MAKPSKDTTSVTARISNATLSDIDALVARKSKEKKGQTYSRTDAINEVLPLGLKVLQNPKAVDVGLIVLKHAGRLEDPQLVAELKKHLEEIQIVDYIAGLSKDQLDALVALSIDELRLRAGKTPYSLLDPEDKRKILLK